MPTKQELQAEIDRLRAELAANQVTLKDSPAPDLVPGEVYPLNIGQAIVTGFYEEDDLQKVRFILRPVDPEDGHSLLEDRAEVLMSAPIEKFRGYQAQFVRDQQHRDVIAARQQRKRV